jgi:hypothetical protein
MAKTKVVKHDYQLQKVQDLRRTMFDRVMFDFGHRTCEGEEFDILVDSFAECLPSTVSRSTLFDALRYLAGVKLTPPLIDEVSWRLAGNLPRLKEKSVPIGPWTRQAYKEWVPAEIREADHRRDERDRPGWMMSFRILAGTSCPMLIQQHWSKKFCAYAAKHIGFTLRTPSPRSAGNDFIHGKFMHPSELVSMRLLLLIDPDLCTTEPDFKEISITPSLLKWNKTQIKFRDRVDAKHRCPKKYPASSYCYRCPVGSDQCRAATHPRTYTFDYCAGCESSKVPFDTAVSEDKCVFCLEKQAMERR